METSRRKGEGLSVWGQGVPSTSRLPTEPEPRRASLSHALRVGLFVSSQLLQDTGGKQVFPPRVPGPRRAHQDMEGGCGGREGELFISGG